MYFVRLESTWFFVYVCCNHSLPSKTQNIVIIGTKKENKTRQMDCASLINNNILCKMEQHIGHIVKNLPKQCTKQRNYVNSWTMTFEHMYCKTTAFFVLLKKLENTVVPTPQKTAALEGVKCRWWLERCTLAALTQGLFMSCTGVHTCHQGVRVHSTLTP